MVSQGILKHDIGTFVRISATDNTLDPNLNGMKTLTLLPGNYEWPFEIILAGNTTESIECIRKASVTYRLDATLARGNFAYNVCAYKHLRIIRIPEGPASGLSQTISLKRTWLNKIEYSISIPRRAIGLGGSVPLEMRVTPLLKGLKLNNITVQLLETHRIILPSRTGRTAKEHTEEREIDRWIISIHGDEHWQVEMNDTGQTGWIVETLLSLPSKLRKCVQDVDIERVKIRHNLKLVMSLRNLDNHISELQAIIPVTIYISPNIPVDERGNLQLPYGTVAREMAEVAPPGYGEHVLDLLVADSAETALSCL